MRHSVLRCLVSIRSGRRKFVSCFVNFRSGFLFRDLGRVHMFQCRALSTPYVQVNRTSWKEKVCDIKIYLTSLQALRLKAKKVQCLWGVWKGTRSTRLLAIGALENYTRKYNKN